MELLLGIGKAFAGAWDCWKSVAQAGVVGPVVGRTAQYAEGWVVSMGLWVLEVQVGVWAGEGMGAWVG